MHIKAYKGLALVRGETTCGDEDHDCHYTIWTVHPAACGDLNSKLYEASVSNFRQVPKRARPSFLRRMLRTCRRANRAISCCQKISVTERSKRPDIAASAWKRDNTSMVKPATAVNKPRYNGRMMTNGVAPTTHQHISLRSDVRSDQSSQYHTTNSPISMSGYKNAEQSFSYDNNRRVTSEEQGSRSLSLHSLIELDDEKIDRTRDRRASFGGFQIPLSRSQAPASSVPPYDSDCYGKMQLVDDATGVVNLRIVDSSSGVVRDDTHSQTKVSVDGTERNMDGPTITSIDSINEETTDQQDCDQPYNLDGDVSSYSHEADNHNGERITPPKVSVFNLYDEYSPIDVETFEVPGQVNKDPSHRSPVHTPPTLHDTGSRDSQVTQPNDDEPDDNVSLNRSETENSLAFDTIRYRRYKVDGKLVMKSTPKFPSPVHSVPQQANTFTQGLCESIDHLQGPKVDDGASFKSYYSCISSSSYGSSFKSLDSLSFKSRTSSGDIYEPINTEAVLRHKKSYTRNWDNENRSFICSWIEEVNRFLDVDYYVLRPITVMYNEHIPYDLCSSSSSDSLFQSHSSSTSGSMHVRRRSRCDNRSMLSSEGPESSPSDTRLFEIYALPDNADDLGDIEERVIDLEFQDEPILDQAKDIPSSWGYAYISSRRSFGSEPIESLMSPRCPVDAPFEWLGELSQSTSSLFDINGRRNRLLAPYDGHRLIRTLSLCSLADRQVETGITGQPSNRRRSFGGFQISRSQNIVQSCNRYSYGNKHFVYDTGRNWNIRERVPVTERLPSDKYNGQDWRKSVFKTKFPRTDTSVGNTVLPYTFSSINSMMADNMNQAVMVDEPEQWPTAAAREMIASILDVDLDEQAIFASSSFSAEQQSSQEAAASSSDYVQSSNSSISGSWYSATELLKSSSESFTSAYNSDTLPDPDTVSVDDEMYAQGMYFGAVQIPKQYKSRVHGDALYVIQCESKVAGKPNTDVGESSGALSHPNMAMNVPTCRDGSVQVIKSKSEGSKFGIINPNVQGTASTTNQNPTTQTRPRKTITKRHLSPTSMQRNTPMPKRQNATMNLAIPTRQHQTKPVKPGRVRSTIDNFESVSRKIHGARVKAAVEKIEARQAFVKRKKNIRK